MTGRNGDAFMTFITPYTARKHVHHFPFAVVAITVTFVNIYNTHNLEARGGVEPQVSATYTCFEDRDMEHEPHRSLKL